MAVNAKVLAPVDTFVLIAAVGAGFALMGGGSGGSHGPRQLKLANGSSAEPASAPVGAVGAVGAKSNGEYQLTGDLPAGKPADAPAWTLTSGTPDGALVSRLAAALHVKPTQIAVSTKAGQSWTYSACTAPDAAVSSDGATTSCGIAVQAPSASTSALAAVSKAAVRDRVKPVFDALGLDVDKAVIDAGSYGGSATLDPAVEGLTTSTFSTRVDVSPALQVQDATGWLGAPSQADTYPLITAQQAFDTLPSIVHPDICQLPTDGSSGCLQQPAPEITGAHLGLTAAPLQDGGQVLVPAWLFDVKGSTSPIAQIAVEPKYRGAPEPQNAVDDPATTGPAGTSPGSVGSGGGTTAVQPAPPPAQLSPVQPARRQLSVYGAHRGKGPHELVVTYGESGSCPETDVQQDHKEDATHVYVVLTAATMKPGIACTEDFHAVSVTIELTSPLADRTVVDSGTSKDVPVT